MPNFSILLPPSEEKQPGGNPFAPDMFDYRTSNTFNYFNELNSDRRKLIAVLEEVIRDGKDLDHIFGVPGEGVEEAKKINSEIYNAPLMSALDRYSPGVMYKAMDFGGLPTGAQRRLLENGIIFSGLFGLLRPDDLIPDYKLSMNAVLPGIGKMMNFWRPIISPVLNRTLDGAFVWNFLSSVHEGAWDDEHAYDTAIRVEFFTEEGGERKGVTEDAQPLRGKLVNFIVRESLEELEPLLEWTHPDGFSYDPDTSERDESTNTVTIAMVKRV
jgi:hypothetical protein